MYPAGPIALNLLLESEDNPLFMILGLNFIIFLNIFSATIWVYMILYNVEHLLWSQIINDDLNFFEGRLYLESFDTWFGVQSHIHIVSGQTFSKFFMVWVNII